MGKIYIVRMLVALLSLSCLAGGCANIIWAVKYKPAKSAADYEKAGKWWGEIHRINGLKPGDIDDDFVKELAKKSSLDFFGINADLKDAFVKGYKAGYQDNKADLVLEPNFNAAAARMEN